MIGAFVSISDSTRLKTFSDSDTSLHQSLLEDDGVTISTENKIIKITILQICHSQLPA